MGITTTIPTNLDFPNRGVLERDAFVNAQETAQDLLAGAYTTALNQYATELNSTQTDINTKATAVANQAVSGGYSQAYIDATFTPKILNTQTDKTTPVDADLIPLSDSASSFGLKKLSWLNIKATLKTYFDTLYVALAGNQSIDGVKTFISSPIVPTPTAQDNSTKIATTAYVDGKRVLGTAVNSTSGTSIDFTGIPNWVRRVTIMFDGVSTSGTSIPIIQLGSTTIQTTGYTGGVDSTSSSGTTPASLSNGLGFGRTGLMTSGNIYSGQATLNNISSNKWIGVLQAYVSTGANSMTFGSTSVSLSNALDRIRITTVNGTDTFDAGQINIIYEG